MNANSLTFTINSWHAPLYWMALHKAITATEALLKLKSSAPFASALAIELSAYRAEQTKLAEAFPTLKDEAK